MFTTQSYSPDPLLRNIIDHYLFVKADLEDACMECSFMPKVNQQMSFSLGRDQTVYDLDIQEYISPINLIGQNNRICRIRIYEGMSRLMVNFKSTGWYKLFKIPTHRFLNRSFNLQELLGNEIMVLHQQLRTSDDCKKQIQWLDSYFLERLIQHQNHFKNLDEAVQLILELKGNISINQLEKAVFITRRSLERHFLEQTGLYPKMFTRIIRFNEAIKYLERNPRPGGSYFTNCLGYCDQSHFINEFQHFAGCPPTRYFNQSLEFDTVLKS